MLFLNILLLIIIFLGSSYGSGVLLTKFGYRPPRKVETRQDYILIAMKLITFTIFVLLSLALVMLVGLDPLHLME